MNPCCCRFLARRPTPGVAAVITQLSNTTVRAMEQDRRVRELDEIEERLAELERRAENGHQRPAA